LGEKQFAANDGDVESIAAASALNIERKPATRPAIEVLMAAVWADVAGER
jgi:hypothetical protein